MSQSWRQQQLEGRTEGTGENQSMMLSPLELASGIRGNASHGARGAGCVQSGRAGRRIRRIQIAGVLTTAYCFFPSFSSASTYLLSISSLLSPFPLILRLPGSPIP